mmetsp:Transcript_22526/g.27787  ORF Transcript_22526/g.27787 Transcript_22526/m.27787 type:complete len:262 (+) Transcript_22526:98-883(+)|eukprot:CAMPEP_0172502960 /NCGR_PEP_ID=MMETSP1066-20121228/164563_1 /TAXON_ID=671091 /ORGANISM="Coscinodiscus wailesii, Strain CCMP2513" /LENGTH=261 /DNA_ID=CAMNT_0013278455 /DNA_START=98 /DNA_END=883 /DNA_ORIENTATION=+
MCSVSKINEMLALTKISGAQSKAPSISAVNLKHNRSNYFLVDIREPDEITSSPLPNGTTADSAIPMGKLLASPSKLLDKSTTGGKTIVVLCNSGYRAGITAAEVTASGFDAVSLSRGIVGLNNAAATVPDFVVVLGLKDKAEKITLALNACAVAAAEGDTTVLVLMGDGVCPFLKTTCGKEAASETSFRVEDTFVGEPFKPCRALLDKFLGSGNAVVLGCTSCVKKRGFGFKSDLLECVEPMQMPDLMRMLGEAKKSLQFL